LVFVSLVVSISAIRCDLNVFGGTLSLTQSINQLPGKMRH